MLNRSGVMNRKVHFDESQLPVSYDSLATRQFGSYRRSNRWTKAKSLFRVLCTVFFTVLVLTLLRWRFFLNRDQQHDFKARDIVLGNCVSLETLRHSQECYEFVDLKRNYPGSQRLMSSDGQQQQLHRDEMGLKSSFGAVLEYGKAYDAFTEKSAGEERYTTVRTLKCLIGFSMSLVWDFQFETSLLQAYKSGADRIKAISDAGRGKQVGSICPPKDAESSASMSLSINCGIDIERDAWGNPAKDMDHEALETCTRMAYIWVDAKGGFTETEPWANLCHDNPNGEHMKCERYIFQLEGSRKRR